MDLAGIALDRQDEADDARKIPSPYQLVAVLEKSDRPESLRGMGIDRQGQVFRGVYPVDEFPFTVPAGISVGDRARVDASVQVEEGLVQHE